MLQIKANKIKTSGILIPEEVYIRTIQDSREGEIEGTSLKFWYDYRAFLKSEWDINGINSKTINIDNLTRGSITLIDVNKEINSQTLNDLVVFFNKEYIPHLKDCLSLTDDDISIIT